MNCFDPSRFVRSRWKVPQLELSYGLDTTRGLSLHGLKDDRQVREDDTVEREKDGLREGHVVVGVDADVLQAVEEDLDLGRESGVAHGERVLVEEDPTLEQDGFPDLSS